VFDAIIPWHNSNFEEVIEKFVELAKPRNQMEKPEWKLQRTLG
jgi:hypothetical protein